MFKPPITEYQNKTAFNSIAPLQAHFKLLLGFALLLLTACSVITWHEVAPHRTQSSVAEDGSGTAFVMQRYEQNSAAKNDPGNLLAGQRNASYQIFIQPEGGTAQAVSNEISGRAEVLHYKKAAAYILIQHKPNGNKPIAFLQLDLNTRIQRQVPIPATMDKPYLCTGPKLPAKQVPGFLIADLLPSPDGRWLALTHTESCGKGRVLLLDAGSLQVAEQHEVEVVNVNQARWRAEGTLAITALLNQSEGEQAVWLLRPGDAPIRP